MKKQTKTEKLGLTTNTIRRLSRPMADDQLAEVGGGLTMSCLPLTKLQDTHNCY